MRSRCEKDVPGSAQEVIWHLSSYQSTFYTTLVPKPSPCRLSYYRTPLSESQGVSESPIKGKGFGDVKKRLRSIEGAKYGLRFPATLRVTLPGSKERTFEDPTLALDFINREIYDADPSEGYELYLLH
uniref:Uncharacterized protein n=1 Tax=Larimichthys crocea TaxID=215358 RepID=A0A0F8CFM7_LARCR